MYVTQGLYYLKTKYDKKKHMEKIEECIKFANKQRISMQFQEMSVPIFEDSEGDVNELKQTGTKKGQLGVLIQIEGDKEVCQNKLDNSLIKIKEVFYRVPNQLSHFPAQYYDENDTENKEGVKS